jgi:hypothetical protein
MKSDTQAELNMLLKIRWLIEPEIRMREEILGVSPSGPGQSGQAPEPASRLGHSETVPNATALEMLAGRIDELEGGLRAAHEALLSIPLEVIEKHLDAAFDAVDDALGEERRETPVSIPLRGRIA